uniref:Glucuronosyltransferase n=1 Tax=Panagrolaimus sp. PS1159 TaxID=55785 RepID=A0AC35F1P5_9BILA
MLSNGRIADALADAGHNVTFLNIEHSISIKDFPTTKKAKILTMGRIPEERKALMKKEKTAALHNLFQPPKFFNSYTFFTSFVDINEEVFELALTEDKNIVEQLKAEKFDAIFVEQLHPIGNAFGHLLGINVHFLTNTCPLIENIARIFGIPNPTGWVPSVGQLPISDKMTFYERAGNLMENYIIDSSRTRLITAATTLFRTHFEENFPDVEEIIKENTPLIFVNVNEFLEFPRPILHNVVYVGGLGMKATKNKTLAEPFASEMKKGKKGVVFFSLGSNVDSSNLPEIVKKNLIDAFASFSDYHFIIKLETTDDYGINYAKNYPNIFSTNWAPQSDLLQHPRLKLFYTHGGYNSLLEVAQAGKPVLLTPMMYDQTRNAQVIQRNGWGKVINKIELINGKENLVEAMNEMLYNEKYQKEAHRIKHLLETKPFSANEIFIKNVDFVLENGGKLPELKPASMEMNFFTQNNLDIYLLLQSLVQI